MRGEPVTLVGRDEQVRLLTEAVRGAGPSAVVVLGEPGIGKTALLEAAADAAPGRALRIRGVESEHDLPYAALHRFVRPLLPGLDRLPARQQAALRQVFGLDEAGSPPDRLLVGLAALTLVSSYADDGPVLLLVDDAHWIDHASLEVLGFLARRLDGEPVTLLAAARGTVAPAPLGRDLLHLVLTPLGDDDAAALLEQQPNPPRGAARCQVLQLAAGNPLALSELSKSCRRQESWPTVAPPLSDRLEAVFADQLASLPPRTRDFLLRAAIAEGTDCTEQDPEVCVPAEEAGLITIDHEGVTFRHSLIRSAVYQAASPTDRRRAHQKAAAASDDPDRRAWHQAAAAVGPDAEVAKALEATAERSAHRGAYQAAVAALRRAARLSPEQGERGRLLALAAQRAVFGCDFGEVAELAAEAAALLENEAVRTELGLLEGWTLTMTGQFEAAFAKLMGHTESISRVAPGLAVRALHTAANVAYLTGNETFRQDVLRALPHVVDDPDDSRTLFLWASVDPLAGRARLLPHLTPALLESGSDLRALTMVGTAASYLDETGVAGAALAKLLDREHAAAIPARGNITDIVRAGVQFVTGQWDPCADTLAASRAATAESDAPLELAYLLVQQAQLAAVRGATDEARRTVTEALRLAPHPGAGSLAVRARWAAGLAAVADGDQAAAYAQLRHAFTTLGTPVHFRESYYVLPDLAAVAVRTGHRDAVAAILDAALRELGEGVSPRLAALLARAEALLATDPEPAFQRALRDPAGEQWPFERAQVQLDYGQWLRRDRRISQARVPLTAALAVFDRLRSRPWADRARTELRASGVATTETADSAFAQLSAQQQQIARLAAQGLTNREIGERLLLSPRTVSFHLYVIFPKLNITARAQLRDIVDAGGPLL